MTTARAPQCTRNRGPARSAPIRSRRQSRTGRRAPEVLLHRGKCGRQVVGGRASDMDELRASAAQSRGLSLCPGDAVAGIKAVEALSRPPGRVSGGRPPDLACRGETGGSLQRREPDARQRFCVLGWAWLGCVCTVRPPGRGLRMRRLTSAVRPGSGRPWDSARCCSRASPPADRSAPPEVLGARRAASSRPLQPCSAAPFSHPSASSARPRPGTPSPAGCDVTPAPVAGGRQSRGEARATVRPVSAAIHGNARGSRCPAPQGPAQARTRLRPRRSVPRRQRRQQYRVRGAPELAQLAQVSKGDARPPVIVL